MRVALAALVALAACSRRADYIDWQRMRDQSELKVIAFTPTPWFADGRGMRVPPMGTVPREHEPSGPPPAVDAALLARGRDRFEITCAACHGLVGDGDTDVGRAMRLRPPPSLHEARIRAYPPERIFSIISAGFGLMPSYAPLLSIRDRWAVVAYVRALQLSQYTPVATLPPDEAARAQRGEGETP